ncbi:MAG: DUF6794 domain-containing protein [Desulfurivibrionaceae bacterium]
MQLHADIGFCGADEWPTTIDQAVEILLRIVPDEVKDRIARESESNVVGNRHFGLGLWIRNNFGLNQGNNALLWQIEACGSSRILMYFPQGADEISGIIVKAFWRRLQDTR